MVYRHIVPLYFRHITVYHHMRNSKLVQKSGSLLHSFYIVFFCKTQYNSISAFVVQSLNIFHFSFMVVACIAQNQIPSLAVTLVLHTFCQCGKKVIAYI